MGIGLSPSTSHQKEIQKTTKIQILNHLFSRIDKVACPFIVLSYIKVLPGLRSSVVPPHKICLNKSKSHSTEARNKGKQQFPFHVPIFSLISLTYHHTQQNLLSLPFPVKKASPSFLFFPCFPIACRSAKKRKDDSRTVGGK